MVGAGVAGELAREAADVAAEVGHGGVAVGGGDAEEALPHVEARARLLAVGAAAVLDGEAAGDGVGVDGARGGAEGDGAPVGLPVAALEGAVVPAERAAAGRVALEVGDGLGDDDAVDSDVAVHTHPGLRNEVVLDLVPVARQRYPCAGDADVKDEEK